jgi:glyoxylase-like metal-dependent hydrolase (beta-lactamase superfamily II)
MTSFSRRIFLRTAIAGAAGAALSGAAIAPAFAREKHAPLAASRLADNLVLIAGAGANVVAASGAEGALLVDGGLEERSGELLKLVSTETSSRRVHTLINTHWHPEQTGSNVRLGKSGAKIIAHENTKLWLGRRLVVAWRDGSYGPLPAIARPNETTYTSVTMPFGVEQVEYGYLPQAHTDGDLYVFFRKANVLVTGGAVSAEGWPIVDYQTGGWIGGLVAGLDKLIKLSDDNTRIVPANGPVLTRADLQGQRGMYFTIYDRLVKCLTKGLGPEEAAATAPAKEFNLQWGDPQPFVLMAFESLWGHYAPDA